MTNPTPDKLKEYYQPRVNDDYVKKVLSQFELPADASLADVEKLATGLLSFEGGQPVGASLVMGRRVDLKKESEFIGSLMSAIDGKEAYVVALRYRAAEIQARAQQKN